MGEIGPFGAEGPFGDLMRNLAQMLTSQGPLNWDIAKQLAQWIAADGRPEPNVDPVARVRVEELLRIAEMHVSEATGLAVSSRGALGCRAVTRGEWAVRSLEAWQPLLERLAISMQPESTDPGEEGENWPSSGAAIDPMSQLFGNLPQVLGPFLFGMQAGSMVGQLAQRAMGQYDLPMPRPPSDELLLVPATIDAFAEEWSLSADDVRLWVCLREVTNHAVLGQPHVRARLDELLGAYIDAFEPDGTALESRLSQLDPSDMESLQRAFADPGALLGEMQSEAQRHAQVPLRALLSAVTGYVDHVLDRVGRHLVGGYGPLTEALHRRRLEEHSGTHLLGQLVGVELDEQSYGRGQTFVQGVVERAGEEGLGRLWRSARQLPTPAELDAPGLWLARIDLPGEEPGAPG